jgi:hypothetical protein
MTIPSGRETWIDEAAATLVTGRRRRAGDSKEAAADIRN